MPLLIGLDLGTTTITALAIDAGTGKVARIATRPNTCEVTAPDDKRKGRSEWDAAGITRLALDCLRELGPGEYAGIGITGQQHGVLLTDGQSTPLSPLINWQDKRGDEPMTGTSQSWVSAARERAGDAAPARAGCRLSSGYLVVTLFWLKENGLLPPEAKACFLMDLMGSVLTGAPCVTDPTCAASSGSLDVGRGDWDDPVLSALGLSRALLPRVVRSGSGIGGLKTDSASALGLPAGIPVFVGVGDNQASFLGSVADRTASVLVNVGTGGQVAMWSPHFVHAPQVETRPFFDGYLVVAAGLSGGAAYATLERFYRDIGREVLGVEAHADVYGAMNRLAADVPAGADGLVCEPFFAGTRHEPWLKASWTGLTLANLTPGHLARALLEGMARAFAASQGRIAHLCQRAPSVLVGSGNGVRNNPLLAGIIADSFGLPLRVPAHREEAAYGAALLAGVGAGVIADLDEAGRRIVQSPSVPSP